MTTLPTTGPFRLWLLVALMATLAAPASAQPGNTSKAAAEALFQQGRALLAAGQTAAACGKLEASQKLDPAVGTLLFLGDCYEKEGKTASAWATFEEASSLAQRQGQVDRQRIATVRSTALASQLSTLTIVVADPDHREALSILRDGEPVLRASWNTPLPVDPATYQLVAKAPKRRSWSGSVEVAGAGAAVSITIPALELDPSAGAVVDGASAAAGAPNGVVASPGSAGAPAPDGGAAAVGPATASSEPPDAGSGPALLASGVALATAGVGGLAVGTVFGLLADATNADSLDRCRTATLCSPEGLSLREDAQDQATVATVGFVAGGILLAGGVALLVGAATADGPAPAEQALRLYPFGGPTAVGLGLGGAF